MSTTCNDCGTAIPATVDRCPWNHLNANARTWNIWVWDTEEERWSWVRAAINEKQAEEYRQQFVEQYGHVYQVTPDGSFPELVEVARAVYDQPAPPAPQGPSIVARGLIAPGLRETVGGYLGKLDQWRREMTRVQHTVMLDRDAYNSAVNTAIAAEGLALYTEGVAGYYVALGNDTAPVVLSSWAMAVWETLGILTPLLTPDQATLAYTALYATRMCWLTKAQDHYRVAKAAG